MSGGIEIAGIVQEGGGGAVFKGVGDREAESHFTYDVNNGFHVSTYLNLGLDKNKKLKTNQDEFGVG